MGQGIPKDDAEAVRWWKKAAEQGNVEAEGNLGTAYGLGVGVPKDEAESVRWHTKAANNGNAASQLSLGLFYMSDFPGNTNTIYLWDTTLEWIAYTAAAWRNCARRVVRSPRYFSIPSPVLAES